jgi:hypothetical protein
VQLLIRSETVPLRLLGAYLVSGGCILQFACCQSA